MATAALPDDVHPQNVILGYLVGLVRHTQRTLRVRGAEIFGFHGKQPHSKLTHFKIKLFFIFLTHQPSSLHVHSLSLSHVSKYSTRKRVLELKYLTQFDRFCVALL
jgi:hypothetical protein